MEPIMERQPIKRAMIMFRATEPLKAAVAAAARSAGVSPAEFTRRAVEGALTPFAMEAR